MIEKSFVLYKLIDLNNLAVLTEATNKTEESVSYTHFIYIINLKIGRIL